jgi:hypothetical protein
LLLIRATKSRLSSPVRAHPGYGNTHPLTPDGCEDDTHRKTTPSNGGTPVRIRHYLHATTNVRRVHVDNATTPVTFWTGSNHGASIVKLEPLD